MFANNATARGSVFDVSLLRKASLACAGQATSAALSADRARLCELARLQRWFGPGIESQQSTRRPSVFPSQDYPEPTLRRLTASARRTWPRARCTSAADALQWRPRARDLHKAHTKHVCVVKTSFQSLSRTIWDNATGSRALLGKKPGATPRLLKINRTHRPLKSPTHQSPPSIHNGFPHRYAASRRRSEAILSAASVARTASCSGFSVPVSVPVLCSTLHTASAKNGATRRRILLLHPMKTRVKTATEPPSRNILKARALLAISASSGLSESVCDALG